MVRYNKNDICAGIIIYNCNHIIKDNILSLLTQVGRIVLINNGPKEEYKAYIRDLECYQMIEIINSDTNRGIAYGLNQLLQYANQYGFKLLLTMDQDTVLGENAVEEMLDILNKNVNVVSVGASYIFKEQNDKKVNYLITSGNLVKVKVAIRVGGYNNDLFIDSVDIDFSLKLKKYGYELVRSNKAVMKHAIGIQGKRSFLFFNIQYMEHSPLRYYYIYRNHIYIFKEYGKLYKMFCLKMLIILLFDTFKLLFLEHCKKEKIRYSLRGIRDGISKWYYKK